MLLSRLFSKSSKEFPKGEVSINSQLLIKAGFIDKLMAGAYTLLPLGLRVVNKIENIIRQEMNDIGANEILMPMLTPENLWEKSSRLDQIDVLFKVSGGNDLSKNVNPTEYVLTSTHEEVVTPLIQKFASSYKDLPVAVYQIQSKFRNEARPKSGLLRGREFRMKDLYSFHESEEDLMIFYNKCKSAYSKIFHRLGIGDETYITLASGGDFTDDYSHEFQTKCKTGEDIIFFAKSIDTYYNKEVAPSQAPEINYELMTLMEKKEIFGEGLIGVDVLSDFLGIPQEQTTKTLIYETDSGEIIAAALRGNYDINEEKLIKVIGCNSIKLASKEIVKKVTGAEIGYAGILGLPATIKVFMDESMKGRINFEMGSNKTNYHTINVNFGRDLEEPEQFYDFKVAQKGDINPETGEEYEVFNGSEVGNIFPLNTKFSEKFDYYYIDNHGKRQPIYMGCYGIGPTRVMGVIVEKYHDEKGILWPESIAPFKYIIIPIGGKGTEKSFEIYENISKHGIDVALDDRNLSPGFKFKDSDLMGCPYQLVVSDKTMGNGLDSVELIQRKTGIKKIIDYKELLN